MLLRILGIGLLTFVSLLVDSALPAWTGGFLMLPSLLDLALVTVCLKLQGGSAVFWGGLIGLFQDDLSGNRIGIGMMIGASLALVFPVLFRMFSMRQTYIDRLLWSALLLTLLGLCRIGWSVIHGSGTHPTLLISSEMGQIAATFLLLVLWQTIEAAFGVGASSRHDLRQSVL